MRKLFVLLIVTVAGLTTMVAQDAADMKFKELVHDFGTFPEETGKVSCTFEFTNTGKVDIILQNVKASCGCTTPNWTKEPVKPGEKGTVEATYNASGRPGAFNKTITVTSNVGEERLTIKGDVTPKPLKVEDQYPFDMDGLRVKTQSVYLNNVEFPTQRVERIEVINTKKEPVALSFKDIPSYITVKAVPATLQADEKGTIEVTLDSKNAKEWGNIEPKFTVVLNGKPVNDNKFKITLFANIVENFSALTAEQRANAPVLNAPATVNAGEIKVKSEKALKFTIGNDGKSDLIIRKGSSDNKAITVHPPKTIKPGKKDDVKFKINTENMAPGKFTERIILITNDPNRSINYIQITGEVK